MASARFFRPSTGASPATLLAVVFGLVSESWWRVSLDARVAVAWREREHVLCSLVYLDSTATVPLAWWVPLCLRYQSLSVIASHGAKELLWRTHPKLLEAAHLGVLILLYIFIRRDIGRRRAIGIDIALPRHPARLGYSPRLIV
jgi:hypothetical protein